MGELVTFGAVFQRWFLTQVEAIPSITLADLWLAVHSPLRFPKPLAVREFNVFLVESGSLIIYKIYPSSLDKF